MDNTRNNPNQVIWTGTERGYKRRSEIPAFELMLLDMLGDMPEYEPIRLTPLQRVLLARGYVPTGRRDVSAVAMMSPIGLPVYVDEMGCIRREPREREAAR